MSRHKCVCMFAFITLVLGLCSGAAIAAPAPPGPVTVTDVPDDQGTALQIEWIASADDYPGGTVTKYRLFRKLPGTPFAMLLNIPATGAATYSYTDTGLNPGQYYRYLIRAIEPSGVSSGSSAGARTRDNIPPAPPENFTVAEYPDDQGNKLICSWDNSPDDGEGADDVVKYYLSKRWPGTSWTSLGAVVKVTGQASYSWTVRGLEPGVRYFFRLVARDSRNFSTPVFADATPHDERRPAPPRDLSAEDIPDDDGTAVKLTFVRSLDDGARANDVVFYRLWRRLLGVPGETYVKLLDIPATGADNYEYTDSTCQRGATYRYKLRAKDGVNWSAIRTVVAQPIDNRPVAPPRNPNAYDRPADEGGVIVVEFDRSLDDGTGWDHVDHYNIYRKQAALAEDPSPIATVNATGAASYSYEDTGLTGLVLYEYTVDAESVSGALSEPAGPVRAVAENNNVLTWDPPTGLTAADQASDYGGQIRLQWYRSPSEGSPGPPPPPPFSAPAADYGGEYEFYRKAGSGGYPDTPSFSVSADGIADPMAYIDSGLTDGVTYTYKVRYRRGNRISEFTAEASATPIDNLGAPASVSTPGSVSTQDQAAVTVDAPEFAPAGANAPVIMQVAADKGILQVQFALAGELKWREGPKMQVTGPGLYSVTVPTANLHPGVSIRVRAALTTATRVIYSDPITISLQ